VHLADRKDYFTRLSHLPCFGAGRLAITLFTPLLQNRPLSGRVMHLQLVQYLELAHCSYSSRNKRNCTSLPTMILFYQKRISLLPMSLRRCHPSSRRQRNMINARMECARHAVLFRKYHCAQEHPLFYALTTLFPSISRHKRRHIRAAKKDSDSNDDPIFSTWQTYFHPIK